MAFVLYRHKILVDNSPAAMSCNHLFRVVIINHAGSAAEVLFSIAKGPQDFQLNTLDCSLPPVFIHCDIPLKGVSTEVDVYPNIRAPRPCPTGHQY